MRRAGITAVHRWVGLTAGLIIVFLALTGGSIVFAPRTATVASCTHPMPVDRMISAAASAHPSAKATYVYLYGAPDAAAMVRFKDQYQVYLDPCSARVVAQQSRYGGIFGTMESLHKFRFIDPHAGMIVIGSAALALALFLVWGGLMLWWPRRNGTLAINMCLKGRARALNAHMTLGLYASIVVFVVSATAVPLSLHWARSLMFTATRSVDLTDEAALPALPQKLGAAHGRISMESAWRETQRFFPGAYQWASLRVPKNGEPIEAGVVAQNAPHGEARSYVYLDPRDGSVVSLRPYGKLNLGSKLYYWALALHTGRAGGFVVQLLLLLGMLALAVVAYFGLESFIRKRVLVRSARLQAERHILHQSKHSHEVQI